MRNRIVILFLLGLLALSAVPLLAQGVYSEWHQYFERDADWWLTDDVEGPMGRCGDITRYERGSGPVAPSAGHGYAVVENGGCNDYYLAQGFQESGPYAPHGGYSDSWPQSGWVVSLDIYLDPAWAPGTGFDLYISMRMLDDGSLRYFLVPATKAGGMLRVAGHEIDRAGWYTVRMRYAEENGHLDAKLELAQRGRVLFAQPMTSTVFTGEATSSFAVANVGTGYFWFDAISDGLALPIDQHKYRPGK